MTVPVVYSVSVKRILLTSYRRGFEAAVFSTFSNHISDCKGIFLNKISENGYFPSVSPVYLNVCP